MPLAPLFGILKGTSQWPILLLPPDNDIKEEKSYFDMKNTVLTHLNLEV